MKVCGKEVGRIGYGIMSLTWSNVVSDEEAVACMEHAYECGARFFNGGDFYGTPERNSLHVVKKYFEKHPEQANEIVFSLKVGLVRDENGAMRIAASSEDVRKFMENALSILDGKKKIDIFQLCRVSKDVLIEETVRAIYEYVKSGKIGGVGLSEVSADHIARAVAVVPVSAVEVEASLWCTDILSNGVADICREKDIPLIIYSPLCRGALGGDMKTKEGAEEKVGHHFLPPKLQGGAFEHNVKINEKAEKIAARLDCSINELAINWVAELSNYHGAQFFPIPGSSKIPHIESNQREVKLSKEDMQQINDILTAIPARGPRHDAKLAALWEQ